MTEEQFENCKKCLNRKNGANTADEICNLKGKNMHFESKCTDFDLDNSVIVGEQNKLNAIRPNAKRAKIAQLFVWSVMAIEILSIGSSYLQIVLLNSFLNDEEVTDLMINSNDTREQWMGITYLILFAISAFTFILWFRRAYFNLSVRTSINNGEGWAAGAWFVPFMNLIRPYRIMEELFAKTTQLINSKTPNFIENKTTLITAWWGLWIISNFASRLLTRSAKDDTIEHLIQSTQIDIALSLFMIPLSIVTVLTIKSYAKIEEKLSELENTKQQLY